MAVDVSKIPNNNKFDPVREAILQLQSDITSGVAGVGSLNGLTGLLTIAGTSPITVTPSGTTITISLDSTISGDRTFSDNVIISGNLTVNGTTTTISTTELTVEDKNITIAYGSGSALAADGGGITIDGANATMLYAYSTDRMVFNKPVESTYFHGDGSNLTNITVSETDPIYTGSSWYTTTNNSTNWNTAYTYSQVGHLPLSGGTVSGNVAITGNLTVDTNTLFVDATNNRVGILTNTPDYGLDVQTTLRMRDVGQILSFDTTGAANSVQLYTANSYEFWIVNSRGNTSRLTLGNSNISLGTYGTSILHLDTANNRVGINTVAPSYTLDVNGSAAFRNTSYVINSALYSYDTTSGTYLQFYNNGVSGYLTMLGAQDLLLQTNGGNLAVGTTSATQKLEVNGVGLFTGTSLTGNTQTGVYIYDQNIYSLAGSSARPLNIFGQTLSFYTGTSYSQSVIIDADGQVGINEANPSALLHITNNETSDLTHLLLENTDAGTSQAPNLALYRNSSSPAANDALGNILFYGKNASGTQVPYAEIFSEIVDTTAGSHDGRLVFYNYINGSGDYSMVLSGRNLGIGLSSPATNLHVRNTGATALKLENFGTANWMLGVPSGQTYLAFDNVNNDLSAPKVVINSSGYLGLNTTSPSYLLDVNGSAAFRSSSYALDSTFYGYSSTGGVYLGLYGGTDGRGYLGTTASEDLVLNSTGGNVGIGTTPSTNLEVYDSANPTLRLQTTGTTNQGSIEFGDSADADVGIINYVHDTNKMRFFTNASEKVVITGDGFVGVGVQNPSYQLEVTRSASNLLASFYSTSNVSSFVNIGTSTNTLFANIGLTSDNGTAQIWNAGSTYVSYGGANSLNFYAPLGVSMAWHPNGAQNQMVLSTSGTLSVVGDIVGYSSSDKALKENIKPIEDALDKISKISGYEFDWNDKQDVYEGHDVGVIAQEIEDVLPEVVTTRDNGYKAVKYEKLAPLLIQAIKEQQELIEDLKAEIKHIKGLF